MAKHAKHAKTEEIAAVEQPGRAFEEQVPHAQPTGSVEGAATAAAPPKRNGGKIAGIVIGVIVAILLVVYLGGAFVFSSRFLPNTAIGETDISMKSTSEVQTVLADRAETYAFTVTGQGFDLSMTGKEAGISLDAAAVAKAMKDSLSPWAWPVEVFSAHDVSDLITVTYGSTALDDAVNAQVAAINETATPPTNATASFDAGLGKFAVVAEVPGTQLDPAATLEEVKAGTSALNPDIQLTGASLVQPTVVRGDERLNTAAEAANALIKANLDLYMDSYKVTTIGPELISTWVTITPEVTAEFNDEAMSAWLDELAAACNTVGNERTYTRPDGKVCTVKGGVYGWEIDTEATRNVIIEAVKTSTVGDLSIPVTKSGQGFEGLGGKDWGNRYADVDLSEQHARFYDENGQLIWESDIVSGAPWGGRSTPTGVYQATKGKASPQNLYGEYNPETKEYSYITPVKYWMPFVRNSIGFHDATWQSSFGGSRYKTNGSHGCINLPLKSAAALWPIIQVGDVVVVHW